MRPTALEQLREVGEREGFRKGAHEGEVANVPPKPFPDWKLMCSNKRVGSPSPNGTVNLRD